MTDGTLTMGQFLAAKRHKAKGYTYKTVAFKVGATEKQVRDAIGASTTMPPRKKPGRQPKTPYHRTATDASPFGRQAAGVAEPSNLQIPRDVLLDRERRLSMDPPPFGDPLPGYSALDRMRSGQ